MFCSCEKASSSVTLHLPAVSFLARQSFFVPLSGFFLFLKTAKRKLKKKKKCYTHTHWNHLMETTHTLWPSATKQDQVRAKGRPVNSGDAFVPYYQESAFVKTPKEERKPPGDCLFCFFLRGKTFHCLCRCPPFVLWRKSQDASPASKWADREG